MDDARQRPSRSAGRKNFEHIIGDKVSAISAEMPTEEPIAMPSSENRRPIVPSRKMIGTNTAISTAVVAMTAKATWRVPRVAAISGGSPRSMRRCTFSSTTMASSTTRPIASTSASSVRRLIETPNAASSMNEPIRQTGTVTAGISAARKVPRKRKMTMSTSAPVMPSVT